MTKGTRDTLAGPFVDGRRRRQLMGNGRLTNADDVELETTLEELALDLAGDAVETNVALGVDGRRRHGRHFRERDGLRLDGPGLNQWVAVAAKSDEKEN